ncbi:hypothetical protein, partial [Aeromonas lacus]|uniref:hypothetical protein n=1 Tax=Aeromonas lacus TaxID=558884 RepID=UPI0013785947
LSTMPEKGKRGPKKKLTPEQEKMAVEFYTKGKYSFAGIGAVLGVSDETIRRAVLEHMNKLNK